MSDVRFDNQEQTRRSASSRIHEAQYRERVDRPRATGTYHDTSSAAMCKGWDHDHVAADEGWAVLDSHAAGGLIPSRRLCPCVSSAPMQTIC